MSIESPEQKVFRAVVERVAHGINGKYAASFVNGIGIVTFSLDSDVWDGDDPPLTGEEVSLTKLRKMRSGWRALQASRIHP